MATSDSEDFESADEGFEVEDSPKKKPDSPSAKQVEQVEQKPVAPAGRVPTPTQAIDPPLDSFEEPPVDSVWEPEDLDDDILDSIDDKISTEEPVLEVISTLEELQISELTPFEAKKEVKQEPEKTENFEEEKEEPKVEGTKKERRQRVVREAKGVTKLASAAGSKKLGSKVVTEVVQEPKAEETRRLEENESVQEIKNDVDVQKSLVDSVPSVLDKLSSVADQPASQSSGWGSWGGWGSSLLSTATSSVSSLGSHVISTVIDTVESGLGAPDPEDIAKEQIVAAATVKEPPIEPTGEEMVDSVALNEAEGSFPLGSWISGVSQLGKMVESTGSKVLTGGLDTLENIGKKTMQVLQDGDPGLKKKRALFEQDKPVLSQALREAKEMADQEEKAVEEKMAARKVHFETLFDDYQGLVHLEALEMLSRQCEMKLQSSLLKLAGVELKTAHEKLVAIRDESILPSTDDLDEPEGDLSAAVEETVAALPVKVSSDKLLKIWNDLQTRSEESNSLAENHAFCVSVLAELTSACVEIFHRIGELLTVNDSREPLKEAEVLQRLTVNVTLMVEKTATLLCDRLNEKHGDKAQPIITKVFLEASNSSTYIQDAFQLLMPVLQQAALQ